MFVGCACRLGINGSRIVVATDNLPGTYFADELYGLCPSALLCMARHEHEHLTTPPPHTHTSHTSPLDIRGSRAALALTEGPPHATIYAGLL